MIQQNTEKHEAMQKNCDKGLALSNQNNGQYVWKNKLASTKIEGKIITYCSNAAATSLTLPTTLVQ